MPIQVVMLRGIVDKFGWLVFQTLRQSLEMHASIRESLAKQMPSVSSEPAHLTTCKAEHFSVDQCHNPSVWWLLLFIYNAQDSDSEHESTIPEEDDLIVEDLSADNLGKSPSPVKTIRQNETTLKPDDMIVLDFAPTKAPGR